MDYAPREIFALIMEGERDEVLRAITHWYCVSCYACRVRCPKDIAVTDIKYTLTRMSGAERLYEDSDAPGFSERFIGFVENYGRSFELGLATRYHLAHRPLKIVGQTGLAFDLLSKKRLGLRPEKIKKVDQFKAILAKPSGWRPSDAPWILPGLLPDPQCRVVRRFCPGRDRCPGPRARRSGRLELLRCHRSSERCTPAVEAAIPRAVERVLEMLALPVPG